MKRHIYTQIFSESTISVNRPKQTISVITVVLNAAKSINESIRSVRNQSYPYIEYIIIDGGSTDGTLDVISEYRSRVKILVSEPDSGIYNAMNKGISLASGEILFFLNSDDYFCDNEVINDVVSVFNENPEIDLIFGNQIFDHGNSKTCLKQNFHISRKQLARMTIQHQTIFARKKLFEHTNGFSEQFKIVSDYEWILKVFLGLQSEYLYIDRDISVMGTSGVSWKKRFEKERMQAMRDFFSYWEIFKWRFIPANLVKLTNLLMR